MVDKKDKRLIGTGTDLKILDQIEQAWARANPSAMKRNTAASNEWFRKNVTRNFANVRTSQLMRDSKMWRNKPILGKMILFEYADPVHKDTLPIYDQFPMVFPFNIYRSKEGKLIMNGLNLHYLKPELRLVAFRALLTLRNEKRYRESTKLKMEWDILKAMSESKYFKHSVHSYRLDVVSSVFIEIPAQSWELVLFAPLARWKKGTKEQAWRMD